MGVQVRYEAAVVAPGTYQVRTNLDGGGEGRVTLDNWNREIAREQRDFGNSSFNRIRTHDDPDQPFLPGAITIPSLSPEIHRRPKQRSRTTARAGSGGRRYRTGRPILSSVY